MLRLCNARTERRATDGQQRAREECPGEIEKKIINTITFSEYDRCARYRPEGLTIPSEKGALEAHGRIKVSNKTVM